MKRGKWGGVDTIPDAGGHSPGKPCLTAGRSVRGRVSEHAARTTRSSWQIFTSVIARGNSIPDWRLHWPFCVIVQDGQGCVVSYSGALALVVRDAVRINRFVARHCGEGVKCGQE